jgi:hypothetical protein
MPLNLLVFREQLLIKENASYLASATSVSNYIHHVFLTSCLSNVNQQQYIRKHVCCVVAKWMHGVMGLNPGQVIFFFFHAGTMLLFYITQRITVPKFHNSQKSTAIYHCTVLLQVVLMLILAHKFFVCHVGINDCRKLKTYVCKVHPSGTMSIPNFIEICPAVLKLNHMDGQTCQSDFKYL